MSRNNTIEKLYYSISEVSQMTGLEQYVLRFWEKEFPTLKPKKNRAGNRVYTSRDIEEINRINHLRSSEKLTIEGARKRLTMKRGDESKTSLLSTAKARTIVSQIRKDVKDLLKLFP